MISQMLRGLRYARNDGASRGSLSGRPGIGPIPQRSRGNSMKTATLFATALTAVLACQTTFAQEKDNAARRQPDNPTTTPPASGVQSDNPAAQRDKPGGA